MKRVKPFQERFRFTYAEGQGGGETARKIETDRNR